MASSKADEEVNHMEAIGAEISNGLFFLLVGY